MKIIDIRRELHRKSFYHFVKDFWETVEPVEFIDSMLMQYLCDLFQFAIRYKLPKEAKKHWINDEEYKKIIDNIEGKTLEVRLNAKQHWNINMPPRHAKSLILNIFASVWLYTVATGEQTVKVATLSHTSKLANEMNDKKQQIINSEQFLAEFPDIALLVNQSDRIIGSNLAEIYSVSMDKLTGRGLNYAILDDLVTAQSAAKQKEELRNALRFMKNTLPSRMNKSSDDAIINIAQRLGPGDVSDFIMNELSDLYQTVSLQAIADEDVTVVFPCSGKIWEIKAGESLFPERFTVADYLKIKKQTGETIFETQYQQNAIATNDTIIKQEMVQFMNEYDAEYIMSNYDNIYASHDLPVSEKETADMHGAVIAYKKGSTLLFTDAIETHFGFIGSQNFIKTLASEEEYKGIIQLIENKANGAVVIQTLQNTIPGIITIEPGSRSKTERLKAASYWMTAKNIYFLTNRLNQLSPAMKMLITRITSFPFVRHDDVVDAFSQLINYVYIQKSFGLFEESISEENYITNLDDYSGSTTFSAVIRDGFEYAALKVAYSYTKDTFYVLEEITFRGDSVQASEKLKQFTKRTRATIDATKENIIYNTMLGKLNIINNTDNRKVSSQISQINLGLAMNKIKLDRSCVELRGDLDRISWDDKALQNGVERLKSKERLVACLRSVIYFVKGDSEFY